MVLKKTFLDVWKFGNKADYKQSRKGRQLRMNSCLND